MKAHVEHKPHYSPDRLDDYITEENDIRVIDVFIDSLDLQNLGFKTVPADTGRPAYHPSTLLKLFVYGYLNRIQSTRRLEREAGRNVELMWLLGRLAPDFKTIADFRKDNGKGIKNTCRAFIGLCRQMNMFTDVIVAIDGSKFKAVNSKENNYTPKKLQFHIARVEKHIDKYLKQLDDSDKEVIEAFIDGLSLRIKPFLINQKGDHQSLKIAFEAAVKIESSAFRPIENGAGTGSEIICFKCQEKGHKANVCPKKKKDGFSGFVADREEEDYLSMMESEL